VHYSLLDFNSEALREMQKTCNELGVAIIAYNTIGQGLLTDKLTEDKFAGNLPARMLRIKSWDELAPLRSKLRQLADIQNTPEKKEVTMAQIAIAWARRKGTIPLVGCRSKQQAEDTLGSLSINLTKDEIEQLDLLALNRCTLDSPRWRRKLFVVLAGVVSSMCGLLDALGVSRGYIEM